MGHSETTTSNLLPEFELAEFDLLENAYPPLTEKVEDNTRISVSEALRNKKTRHDSETDQAVTAAVSNTRNLGHFPEIIPPKHTGVMGLSGETHKPTTQPDEGLKLEDFKIDPELLEPETHVETHVTNTESTKMTKPLSFDEIRIDPKFLEGGDQPVDNGKGNPKSKSEIKNQEVKLTPFGEYMLEVKRLTDELQKCIDQEEEKNHPGGNNSMIKENQKIEELELAEKIEKKKIDIYAKRMELFIMRMGICMNPDGTGVVDLRKDWKTKQGDYINAILERNKKLTFVDSEKLALKYYLSLLNDILKKIFDKTEIHLTAGDVFQNIQKLPTLSKEEVATLQSDLLTQYKSLQDSRVTWNKIIVDLDGERMKRRIDAIGEVHFPGLRDAEYSEPITGTGEDIVSGNGEENLNPSNVTTPLEEKTRML